MCIYKADEEKCIEANKKCADYGFANPDATSAQKIIEGDICDQLDPGDDGNRCFYSNQCRAEFNKCEDAPITPEG